MREGGREDIRQKLIPVSFPPIRFGGVWGEGVTVDLELNPHRSSATKLKRSIEHRGSKYYRLDTIKANCVEFPSSTTLSGEYILPEIPAHAKGVSSTSHV